MSLIEFIEWIDVTSTFSSILVNYFYWIMMRWYFFTYIVLINYFIINTNTRLCISLFLQSDECIKWTFGLNVDTRKVLVSHNIITFWCIHIIRFATVDVSVNSSTYPILRNEQHLCSLFPSWQCKRHNYFFYLFVK